MGNYVYDESKEIVDLKQESRDVQDALGVLKERLTFWKNDGSYLPESYRDNINFTQDKRRVSDSRIMKYLGVSRSSYSVWLRCVLLDTEKWRESVKFKIKHIYEEQNQNYCASKITKKLSLMNSLTLND